MMGWAREGGELDAQVKLSTDSPCLTKVTITGAILVAEVWVRVRREGKGGEVE